MSKFESLVLRGIWILIRLHLRTGRLLSGTEEVMWAKEIAEALNDESLRKI